MQSWFLTFTVCCSFAGRRLYVIWCYRQYFIDVAQFIYTMLCFCFFVSFIFLLFFSLVVLVLFILYFQNSFVSALPYLIMWLFSIASGLLADHLRTQGILTTTATRRIFNSIGKEETGRLLELNHILKEYLCCTYMLKVWWVNQLLSRDPVIWHSHLPVIPQAGSSATHILLNLLIPWTDLLSLIQVLDNSLLDKWGGLWQYGMWHKTWHDNNVNHK